MDDDKDETTLMQEVRTQERRRGDGPAAWTKRKVEITVDRVLRPRGTMTKNMANGPRNCMVTEVLQVLPVESVYEITHWLEKKIHRRTSCSCSVEPSTFSFPQKALM